jgi:hypothetical protein
MRLLGQLRGGVYDSDDCPGIEPRDIERFYGADDPIDNCDSNEDSDEESDSENEYAESEEEEGEDSEFKNLEGMVLSSLLALYYYAYLCQ